MNSLRLEFYKRLAHEYPDLPLSELSPEEEENFFARAKHWADDWGHVTDYVGTHECDILANCVSNYNSKVSLQRFREALEKIDMRIDEIDEYTHVSSTEEFEDWRDNEDSPDTAICDSVGEPLYEDEENDEKPLGPRVEFSDAARILARQGYSQERLEEVISNVFEQEEGDLL